MNEYDKNWCLKLLNDLHKMPITAPFRAPVDPIRDNAPRYLEIITHPMDLGTMKKKLTRGEYTTVKEFVADIQLICDNAKKYNGETSMFVLIGDDVMAFVNRHLSEKANSVEEEWYKQLSKITESLNEHIRSAPTEISLINALEEPPDFDVLPEDKIKKILLETGENDIQKVKTKWPILSSDAHKNILKIIE
ncbi:Bromodomain containing protein [Histomonas meleagridis]|uniref:Bromodomain containing protein n=1 Tax=Histomonas meleagridis TaxID=135588 RepID=UPI003559A99F|nr:Bromodomain containing protein [Histomonas meleagridis]KAH0798009.1 Bromodomain containing protein [Histomonas meleagridis]